MGTAADRLYDAFWHWFCDDCIEAAKRDELSLEVLIDGLIVFIKLLHPFAPFVTEAVYQEVKKSPYINKKLTLFPALAVSPWPSAPVQHD
ncbi:MAG: hypothetical protein COU69_02600 [Candidatus Pacebacteria bacterium CG10_big_fil_rev_8_21_14_0_10_56_10]|nr:MAG: hypothetical protein COU69_02600 [Candidatus Pacebacteria bacterium CG10_big_fil_rev_8_21_14_0_10_56_10]